MAYVRDELEVSASRSQQKLNRFRLLPEKPGSGSQVSWNNFDKGSAATQVMGFLGAIANTMQNWRDNLQATAPDYRNRIVQISLKPGEGGLNLAMPKDLITTLSKRGLLAGELLRTKFDFPTHIWARFRLTICGLSQYLQSLRVSQTSPTPQSEPGLDYIYGRAEVIQYKCSQRLADLLRQALDELVQMADSWKQNPGDPGFCADHSPKPEPVLRSQPKF